MNQLLSNPELILDSLTSVITIIILVITSITSYFTSRSIYINTINTKKSNQLEFTLKFQDDYSNLKRIDSITTIEQFQCFAEKYWELQQAQYIALTEDFLYRPLYKKWMTKRREEWGRELRHEEYKEFEKIRNTGNIEQIKIYLSKNDNKVNNSNRTQIYRFSFIYGMYYLNGKTYSKSNFEDFMMLIFKIRREQGYTDQCDDDNETIDTIINKIYQLTAEGTGWELK